MRQARSAQPRNGATVVSQGREPLDNEDTTDSRAPEGRQYARSFCRPFGACRLAHFPSRGSRPWLTTVAFSRLRSSDRITLRRITPSIVRRQAPWASLFARALLTQHGSAALTHATQPLIDVRCRDPPDQSDSARSSAIRSRRYASPVAPCQLSSPYHQYRTRPFLSMR